MSINLSSGAKLEAWDFNKVIMIIMSLISIWNYSRTFKNFQGMRRPCSKIACKQALLFGWASCAYIFPNMESLPAS